MSSSTIRPIFILLCSLELVACSSTCPISTNLDPQNIEQYFAPSQIKVLSAETDLNQAKYLGSVTGHSCQADLNDIPANDADARTELRRQAAKLGANAVRVQSCQAIEPKTDCVQSRICIGQAVVLEQQ